MKSRRAFAISIASTASIRRSSRRWRRSGCSAARCRRNTAAPGMDYISLGLDQRRARVRRHVAARDHVGACRAELPDAAVLGHRGSEAALPRAAGAGHEDRHLRADRAGRRQRRARHPDRGGEEGRPLPPHAARRCGSRSPTSPTTSSCSPGAISRRRSSAIRPGSARSSSSARSRGSRAARSRRSGASSPATPASSRWTRSRSRKRTWSGRPGEGFKIAMFALDQGRYTVAAGATGLIRACRDASSLREGARDVRLGRSPSTSS